MADKKQMQKRGKTTSKFTSKKPNSKSKRGAKGGKEERRGPRLPSGFRKQLDNFRKPNLGDNNIDDDEEIDSDEGDLNYAKDLYEYEEEVAEEESTKNRRFDRVENFEYELPEKFKDEDILSDEDDEDLGHGEDDEDSGHEKVDDGKHARMLHDITGIPTEAFEGRKRKRTAVSEAYPESEFNPSRDVLSGNGQISIQDLLDPLRGAPSYSKLRKRIEHVEKKGESVHAPLPKPERERVERGAAYDHTKKDITKWEHLVKRNREAPTLYFDHGNDIGLSTVGAIASEFKPRSDFEKAIASIMDNNEFAEAYRSDGAKLLELNKISVEEVKERQDRLAKMRSLLFRHELKAKHIKKIKSKSYHRLKKKDKLKAASSDVQTDPDAAKELAEKQERKRAEARMTLRHKNQGKWAKRVLERGLSKQDEGTQAAIAEQLHLHNLLTRKMNSMKDNSSSDDSSDEEDEDFNSSDEEGASKLLAKAKENTIKLMEQEDEVPDSGVLSLPFMVQENKSSEQYEFNHLHMARRALKNMSLTYLALLDDRECTELALSEYKIATNMTDQFAALAAITQNPGEHHDEVLADFYNKWQHHSLVVNKWFALQAMSDIPGNVENVKKLLDHPAFDLRDANKVYSLIGGFRGSLVNFHAKDGSGYKFLGELVVQLDKINPQMASGMVSSFSRWRRYDENRQNLAKEQLEMIMSTNGLSENVFEIASKSLAA